MSEPLFEELTPLTEIVPNVAPLSDHLPTRREFLGQPHALWVLVVTEAWLSFSLYGMQAILVLYMKNSLLLPQTVGKVWGFGMLRAIVDVIYAPASIPALAGAIMGLFLAALYATPILGGFLADRVLGRTRTIVLGSVFMTCGHVLMAFERSFVLALLFLFLGIGLAGSLKAQVGAIYSRHDRRRADAYQIYSLGVQIAVIVSPIACASLSQIAWHWGFLMAGVEMALGLVCYLAGRHLLPPDVPVSELVADRVPLSRKERRSVLLLLSLVVVLAVGALPNSEIFDGYLIWGELHYRLSLFGHPFPVSDLISLDGAISTVTALGVLWFWQFYARFRSNPPEITKIAAGVAISAFSPLLLAAGSLLEPGAHQVSLLWGIAFHALNDVGFAMYYGIGMALFSRLAPPRLNAMMVSCFSLHVCLSNLLVGKLATLLTRMPGVSFWFLHAALAGVAALVLVAMSQIFRETLAPSPDQGDSITRAAS